MSGERFSIEVPGKGAVSAIRADALQTGGGRLYVYAPGAGANLDDLFGAYLAERLPSQGLSVLRFQFPYMEAGRRAPDRPPVLEATWRAAIAGGAALGARPADRRALHGRPYRLDGRRGRPPPSTVSPSSPTPCTSRGSRSASATRTSLLSTCRCSSARGPATPLPRPPSSPPPPPRAPNARVHVLQGADHSFAARKADGRTREDIWAEAAEALIAFAAALP